MTVGVHPFGGTVTLHAAPVGFRTDTVAGLVRVGVCFPNYNDVISQGRAIEGFILIINGRRYANAQLGSGPIDVGGTLIQAP